MNHKIIINGKFLSQQLTGVQRVAYELIRHIDHNSIEKNNFELALPRGAKKMNVENITQKRIGLLKGNAWEQISLPMYAGKKRILNLGNVAPLISPNCIIFVHDISFHVNRRFFSKSFVLWYELIMPKILESSSQIFVNSEFTKSEIIKYYGIKGNKISVFYLGHEHISSKKADRSNILKTLGLAKNEYILVVSSSSPNKNFSRLCKAIKSIELSGYDIPLVIAGGDNSIFKQEGLDKNENIHRAGYVSDKELIVLYKHARLFVFPSIYEGFGLPPLEALKLGTPSVVSKTGALPEIYEDAVLYCDPLIVEDIKEKILELWENEELRLEYLTKGEKILNKCSWKTASKNMLKKINE